MTKKKTASQPATFASSCGAVVSNVISFFILALVIIFPLIYHNSYFDILETKYQCYYLIILGMMVVLLVIGLAMLVIDRIEYKGIHAKGLFAKLAPKNWKSTFGVGDVTVILFLLISVISTLQSEYVFESFWGNEGRYTGLFLLTLYVSGYFIISRFWNMKSGYLDVLLISGMIMCVIGITDYFQMDILNFRERIKPEQSAMFTSTVGNINTYTAYVGLMMALSATMFSISKKIIPSIWYGSCMVITFFAMIMGCSDNAYLAIGALFVCLPLILFKSKEGVRRYLVIGALFVTVIQCLDLINQKFGDVVLGLDSLFQILVNFPGLLVIMMVLWGLVVWAYCLKAKTSQVHDNLGKNYIYAWLGFLGGSALVLCFVLYDANVVGNVERYGALGKYVVFNDSWGTNRGYIWRKTLELYGEFPLVHKLFGYGPETFGILTTNEIKFDMVNATGQVFDSPHNEYLQYLITIGPLGLAAYVTFVVASCVRMVKNRMSNPYIIGCCIAVICYSVQAMVNLNLPIATPIMWLLLSVGVAACREKTVGIVKNF